MRFVPEHERIQIDTTYQAYEQDEFDAADIYNPTSPPPPPPPPPPMPDMELNSDNDLANRSAASGFDYLPRAPAQMLFPKWYNSDQLAGGSCHF